MHIIMTFWQKKLIVCIKGNTDGHELDLMMIDH